MISISTGSLYHLGTERTFQIIKKAGFKYVELLLRPIGSEAYFDTWDLKYLKQLEKIYKLKIVTIHIDFQFEEIIGNLENIKKLSKNIDAKYIIMHLPRKKQVKYKKWFKLNLKKIQNSKTILVENMGDETIIKNPQKLNQFAGINFDIAHSLRAKENTIKIIEKLKNIKQFHVSGFDGEHCHKSIFENKQLIQKSLSKNINAIFCLEISPKAFKNHTNLNIIVKDLIIMRKFLENIKNE